MTVVWLKPGKFFGWKALAVAAVMYFALTGWIRDITGSHGSAWELGAVYSRHYRGGGNILECIVFGHVAGERAAVEKSWS
jgi:hypothetical protein